MLQPWERAREMHMGEGTCEGTVCPGEGRCPGEGLKGDIKGSQGGAFVGKQS